MFVCENKTEAVDTAAADTADLGARNDASPAGLGHLPLELIEREIEALAAQITAGNARWLELVAEFDRREGWANTGCRSICEWVAWRCALNPRSAREQVRVARALDQLELIPAAFRSGELSYSKVRALTRIAEPESEADLLELARHATAAQLERMVRAARRVTTREADRSQRESFLRWSWDDDDGCLRIEAKLAPEQGAAFLRALEASRDALYEQRLAETRALDGGSAEPPETSAPRPPSPSNAECLEALCDGGERYQVMVHVDVEQLGADESSCGPRSPCHLADGPGIATETARRICCDASLVPVVSREGEPEAVGRRRRAVPPATRRALVARDGCCQFPGCERRRFVDAHHIVHWARGGKTELDNLILLCRHHHRLVHEGGFSLSIDAAGRARFTDPLGNALPASPPLRPGPPQRFPTAPILTGTGEWLDLRLGVDATVDAVLRAREVRAAGAPG